MKTISLLYSNEYAINDKVKITIPKVRDVIASEDDYYAQVSMMTSMPIDMMVQLDDAGIDFTKISEYELFILMFNGLKDMDTHLLFGDMDVSKFVLAEKEDGGSPVLIDVENDIVIDIGIQLEIADILRRIHGLEKNLRKPGNDEAQRYLIERARKKMKRQKNKRVASQLESLIIAMVNTEQFKYNYDETLELSIYQFNESVRQIINKIDYEHRMAGVYAGTVSTKDLNPEDLTWFKHDK